MMSRPGLIPAACSSASRRVKNRPIPAHTTAGSVTTRVARPADWTECMTISWHEA
jgi:hypothetical protein